jgi:predicted PurR-regulated permease PerM
MSEVWKRVLFVLAGIAAVGVILYALRGAIVGLVFALIIAYLMDPIIDRFESRGLSRSKAIFLCVLIGTVVSGLLLLFLIPMVARELADLSQSIDGYVREIQQFSQRAAGWVNDQLGTELSVEGDLVAQLAPLIKGLDSAAVDPITSVLWALGSSTVGVVLALLNLILVPVYAFYFLRDFDRMKTRLHGLVPVPWQERASQIYGRIDHLMGRFIRGQLTICGILAVLYTLGLVFFARIDLAVLVGVTSGLLFIVPYLGTIFGVVVATLLCLVKWGIDLHLLGVVAAFGVPQLIEGTLLTPRILGDSTGLHPVAVILSLIVGTSLFGFMGMLLAVPAAAAIKVLLEVVEEGYRASVLYLGGPPASAGPVDPQAGQP